MKWPETWIGNLVAFVAVALFGALLLPDEFSEPNIVESAQVLSSLILAITAVVALKSWNKQESTKFKAVNAAEIHAHLKSVQSIALEFNEKMSYQHIEMALYEHVHDKESQDLQILKILSELEDDIKSIMIPLSVARSKARILGSEFEYQIENLTGLIDKARKIGRTASGSLYTLMSMGEIRTSPARVKNYIHPSVGIQDIALVWVSIDGKCKELTAKCEGFIDFK